MVSSKLAAGSVEFKNHDTRLLEKEVVKKRETRKSWTQKRALCAGLKSERTFDHHDAMPPDLDPLNGIIIRLHLDKNP